jgi:hypothetical protein
MVRRVLAALTGLLVSGLMVFCACRTETSFPPRLESGQVSDTAMTIGVLPTSGAVQISKNGWRAFDLDAIVTDEDDADPAIRWSLSAGPYLDVRLIGDTARIGPVANQAGESYVVFTATDPGGLSASRTCPVMVFDDFDADSLPDTIVMGPGLEKTLDMKYRYRPSLKSQLVWADPVFDADYLATCALSDSLEPKSLTIRALINTGTTGIYFVVYDPVNHATFHHSTLVTIH